MGLGSGALCATATALWYLRVRPGRFLSLFRRGRDDEMDDEAAATRGLGLVLGGALLLVSFALGALTAFLSGTRP